MNAINKMLIGCFCVMMLFGVSYLVEAKWVDNGGSWTLSYTYNVDEKTEIENAFAAMYQQSFEQSNVSKQRFVNQQVKQYITEVRQAYRAEQARIAAQAAVMPVIDTSE